MPQIHFTLPHNDRPVFELSGTDDWLERIAQFFGRDLAENLIWVESDDGDVQLSGYVGPSQPQPGNNRMQYLFLNGRHIRDRSLQHALGEAYRGLLMTGRYPIAFLNLAMPPELVDVNVHPTKLEVRFQDSGRHLQPVALDAADASSCRPICTPGSRAARTRTRPAPHDDAARRPSCAQELVDWAKGKMAVVGPHGGRRAAADVRRRRARRRRRRRWN